MRSGMKLIALQFTFSVLSFCTVANNIPNVHNVDIVKRHLRWNMPDIESSVSAGKNLKIKYLQPHSSSVGVSDTNAIYIAFTLYLRNGVSIVQNTGVFHFTDFNTAANEKSKCTPATNHAGAYYHFYGKCPSADTKIVASGWWYCGSYGLFFNSDTFNSAGSAYMDGQYYLNTDGTVHSEERKELSKCFDSWKKSGFRVNNWKCRVSTSVNLEPPGGSSRKRRTSDVCNNCDCLTTSSKGRSFEIAVFAYVFFILSLLKTICYSILWMDLYAS